MQGEDRLKQIMQNVNVVIEGAGQLKFMTESPEEAVIVCPTGISADLVFLIEDLRKARHTNIQQVVNLLKATISSLSICPHLVGIGLVFYSEES